VGKHHLGWHYQAFRVCTHTGAILWTPLAPLHAHINHRLQEARAVRPSGRLYQKTVSS